MTKDHIDTTLSTIKIDGTDIDGVSPGSLPFPKPSRSTKNVTTIKDTVQRKGLKILDPGSASFSGIYIPGDAGQIALIAASDDMQEHTFQITVPESGITYEYQAYVSTSYPSEEDENTLFFNVDLEVTGGFVRGTTFASITSITGAGAGITYSPATTNSALPATATDVVLKEATGILTDTVAVAAASSTYIGISYYTGTGALWSSWTTLTSGVASTVPTAYWPIAGALTKARIQVKETGKASRFVNVFIARA